ncbi:MAG: DUF5658 family protein [Psychrobacillus sp.]
METKIESEATEQNRWHYTAILLLLLAISDSLITHFGLSNGYIEEANPIMRFVYDKSIFGFFSIKIFLPILFIWIMTKLKPNALLQLLIAGALFLYAFILFKHIYWIYLLFIA